MNLTRMSGLVSRYGGEVIMFQCDVCGSKEARQETVSEVFKVERRRILVEEIPALVCSRCGEPTFSRKTTERIRGMVHGEAKPTRSEVVEVFEYA